MKIVRMSVSAFKVSDECPECGKTIVFPMGTYWLEDLPKTAEFNCPEHGEFVRPVDLPPLITDYLS